MILLRKIPDKLFRLVCTLILLAGVIALPPAEVRAATTFTVDTATDAHDSNLADGSCNTGLGSCSLRAAIEQAATVSTSGNPVTIDFASGLSGSTFTLIYGTINWPASYISLDGGANNIIISGALLSSGVSIFQISGSHNLVSNLSITASPLDALQVGDFSDSGEGNFNTVQYLNLYGNHGSGIYIHGGVSDGGNDTNFLHNKVGANNTSTLCSALVNNGAAGILIDASANRTVISDNRIVCSGTYGIEINGVGGSSSDTRIENNSIGTDGNNSAIGNTSSGIIDSHGTNTLINNNVISGNGMAGIFLIGTVSDKIYGNKIGTNLDGSAALANDSYGIYISSGTISTLVGSPTDADKRNIISGNGSVGVMVDIGSHNNVLDGNYIGLGADGLTPIPNGNIGVAFLNAPNNTLSTDGVSVVPQFISGNPWQGVVVDNSDGIVINPRTYIGVAANFTSPAGNTQEGVKLQNGATNATVTPGMVMYNGGAGIAVVGDTSTGNFLNPKSIGHNGGLAIDLGDDGYTHIGSHSPPGPNNWINHPIVNVLGDHGFSGFSYPGATVYFYKSIGDPTAAQGGGIYLSSVAADATLGAFNYTFPVGVSAVTMVGCDSDNNCSEMSPSVNNPAGHFIYLPLIIK